MPGIAISTDLIVGFPGEEESDFELTLELVRRVRFDNIFSYTYSPRPGTAALKYGDPVPESVKKERLIRLLDLQAEIQLQINRAQVGRVEMILVEGPSKNNPLVGTGRTLGLRPVNFSLPDGVKSPAEISGKFLPVKIIEANTFSLKGEPVLL